MEAEKGLSIDCKSTKEILHKEESFEGMNPVLGPEEVSGSTQALDVGSRDTVPYPKATNSLLVYAESPNQYMVAHVYTFKLPGVGKQQYQDLA